MSLLGLFGGRKAASAKGAPRPRVVPRWRTPTAMALWCALAVSAVGGAGWFAWQKQLPHRAVVAVGDAAIGLSARAGFVVRDVFVVGRTATSKNKLLNALGIRRGTPILAVDLEAARARVRALTWVSEASVRRLLPGTIIVEIVERRPVAIWQNQRKFALIDEQGQVIQTDDVTAHAARLLVVGDDAPANTASLLKMLETEPSMQARVTAAVRVAGRRWNLRFDSIEVKLPEEAPEEAWRRLAEMQRQTGVLDRPVRSIDLRLPDRLVIRPAPAQPSADGNDA